MKPFIQIFGSVLLLVALCLSVVSCVKNDVDNDDWIVGDAELNSDTSYAKPSKESADSSPASQSSEQLDLPTVPLP